MRFTPEWEIRARIEPVVPDAWVELAVVDRTTRVALEVDLGNEGVAVLRDKLAAYAALPALAGRTAAEVPLALMLVVGGKGVSRLERLRELVTTAWVGPGFVVAIGDLDRALVEQIAGSIDPPVSVSRHGNGREGAGSSLAAGPIAVTGGTPSDA